MAQFHFVEDYERHVANLLATMSVDAAMEAAVGGNYEEIGDIELSQLRQAGLGAGMSVVDLGCGSGRLAAATARARLHIEFTGIDVVGALLDYAASRSPPHYRFVRSIDLRVPMPDQSADIACAFSVFTHLLHHESYLYMEDFHRVLRPGGKLVFSFLEFAAPEHWGTFQDTVDHQRTTANVHLNTFMERSSIEIWARKTGYQVETFIDGSKGVGVARPLGQSSVILCKVPLHIPTG